MKIEDLLKCEFCSVDEFGVRRCYCGRTDGRDIELAIDYSCDSACNKNCYYKQIQQLKEENEELKNINKNLDKVLLNNKELNYLLGIVDQKLEKIKEIAQWHTTNADNEDVQSDMNNILQIIEDRKG